MPLPVGDFGRIVRQILSFIRLASYGAIGVMAFLLAFRVAEITSWLWGIHPLLGISFLLALLLALAIFVGRPVVRFFRVPVVMKPPKLPPAEKRTLAHLARHLEFLGRYLEALPENPEWTGSVDDVRRVGRRLDDLRAEAVGAGATTPGALSERVRLLEREEVARLLAPLDRKAADAIRAEALKLGIATAVSPYGTLDAFLVLWRNCTLVSRIARIYYGRPGVRGTLQVLRDVSVATMAAAYLGDLTEMASELMGSVVGKTAGFLTGPLMEGCLNGVATLRVGYLAKARCRAFSAWTERTAMDVTREALAEAGRLSGGLVRDVVRTVGGGILQLPKQVLGGVLDRLSLLFRKPEGGEPESAPA